MDPIPEGHIPLSVAFSRFLNACSLTDIDDAAKELLAPIEDGKLRVQVRDPNTGERFVMLPEIWPGAFFAERCFLSDKIAYVSGHPFEPYAGRTPFVRESEMKEFITSFQVSRKIACNPQPLKPDFLTLNGMAELTEFITFAAYGEPVTDKEAEKLNTEVQLRDRAKWWADSGPEWLHIELLSLDEGLPPQDPSERARAESWLRLSGLSITEAVNEISVEMKMRETRRLQIEEIKKFVFCEHAEGNAELWGRLLKRDQRSAEGELTKIPQSFSMRSAHFTCGRGYNGYGELTRMEKNTEYMLAQIFERNDPAVDYLEVQMTMDMARKLYAKFRERHTIGDPETEKRGATVMQGKWWPWDVALAHVYGGDADYVTAIAGRSDPGQLSMLNMTTTLSAFRPFRGQTLKPRYESVFDAWHALRRLLADGEIPFRGNEVSGPRAQGAIIPPEEAGTLEPIELTGTETLLVVGGDLWGRDGAWRNVEISREALFKHFPANGLPTASVTVSLQQKHSVKPGPDSKETAIQEAAKKAFPKTDGARPTGLPMASYRDQIRKQFLASVCASDKTFKKYGF